MVHVRCKYRCLGVHTRWNGGSTVELAPVLASERHPENAIWWDATPSGEIKIETGSECLFEVGAYYWVDLERLDAGPPEDEYEKRLCYRLNYITDWGGHIEVSLDSGYAQKQVRKNYWVTDTGIIKGEFKASINNEAAWPAFQGHAGSYWRVVYTFAGPSDEEHNAFK